MKQTAYIAIVSVMCGSGCSYIPDRAQAPVGTPESLLDISSEVVSFQVSDNASVSEVIEWVNLDQPTSAELRCFEEEESCVQLQEVLAQFAVPFEFESSPDNGLTLFYERIITRDCDNRFVTNHINPYNLNYPGFGCSNAANMVQMISDQRQITNPSLKGFMDAKKAYQVHKAYYAPPAVVEQTMDFSEKLSID